MSKTRTPMVAIRHKCLDCHCGSAKSVKFCPCPECGLWPYRFGERPETVSRKIGKRFIDPKQMPDHSVPLEDCE